MTWSRNEPSAAARALPVVLLVDDEEGIRVALGRLLMREGLEVVAVPSALHALQVLDEQAIDVVVTDLHMPGPSGLLLLETVRDGWPEIGRILLTGDISLEVIRSPAVDTVLNKRDTARGLIDSIVQAARRRRRNGEQRR